MPVDVPPDVWRVLGLTNPAQLAGVPAPAPPPQLPPPIPPVDAALPGLQSPEVGAGASPVAPSPFVSLVAPPGPPTPAAPEAAPNPLPAVVRHAGPEPVTPAPRPQAPAAQRAPTPEQQLSRARDIEVQGEKLQMTGIADETDAQRQQARDELAAHGAYAKQVEGLRAEQARMAAENQKIHAQKQAYVDATLRDVDNYKVDQGKFLKEAGLGGMAGWGIAMILSGIGDSLQHKQGPNAVTQMMQDRIKQSVQLQLDQRDQLKERHANAEHALDKFDAFSKDRLAQTNLLEAKYEKQLANMIQEAALKAKDPLAKANGEKAAGALLVSASEKGQKSGEFASTNQIAQGNLGVARANLGVSQFSAKETQRHNLATEGLTGSSQELEALKLEREGRNSEAKLVRERAMGGEVHPVKDATGKTVGSEVGLITRKNGDVWIPNGTETSVSKLQEQHNAALKLIGTIDEIRKLGPEWISDASNSDKKQRLDELFGTAKLQAIAANNLGVPTGKDVELATGALGTDNPTRLRTQLAGLQQARDTMVKTHQVQLRTAGLDKDWEPDDINKVPPAPPSPTQEILTTLRQKPDEDVARAHDLAFADAYKATGGDIAKSRIAANLAMAEAKAGRVDPLQRRGIDVLKAQAIAGDGAARAALEDAAKSGSSKRVKELAAEALSEVNTAVQPQETATSSGPVYDPQGYDPQNLINRFQRPPGAPTIQP